MAQATRWTLLPIGIAGLLMTSPMIDAEVIRDGSMGPAGPLPGPFYDIQQAYGKTVGTNLFHSFSRFDLNRFEAAVFSGESSIENIFARVTGGSRSTIDGLLGSSIPSANLWFINPAGVLFGPHASINVDGSFYVSTANYLRFADGFRLDTQAVDPGVLTTAVPEAFGFLDDNPAPIDFVGAGAGGAASKLKNLYQSSPLPWNEMQVSEGATLGIFGGDISLSDGFLFSGERVSTRLRAPAGRMQFVSAASAGEVDLNARFSPNANSKDKPGRFLFQSSLPGGAFADVSGSRGGDIVVRAGELRLLNSSLVSDTTGARDGGLLDVKVQGTAFISTNGAGLYARTSGAASGTDVSFSARDIALSDGAVFAVGSSGNGSGGRLSVHASNNLTLDSASFMSSTSRAEGPSGDIDLKAEHLAMSNLSAVQSAARGSGQSGDISIATRILELTEGAFVASDTSGGGAGKGGKISVEAEFAHLNNANILSHTAGTGSGGAIDLSVGTVLVDLNSTIGASTEGEGAAGDVNINARESVTVRNATDGKTASLIRSTTRASGAAGKVSIQSPVLNVDGGATVETTTTADGAAGNVEIDVDHITLTNGGQIGSGSGAVDSRRQQIAAGRGDAGTVRIKAKKLEAAGQMTNDIRSGVFTQTIGGKGGTVDITADEIHLSNRALIATDTAGDSLAGTVDVRSKTLRLQSGAEITSRSGVDVAGVVYRGQGSAGNIRVNVARKLTLTDLGTGISTSTLGSGNAGTVAVQARSVDIRNEATIGSSSELGATGHAGDIELTAQKIGVRKGASILAETYDGAGGTIDIKARNLELRSGGGISTTSRGAGKAGDITIRGRNGRAAAETVAIEGRAEGKASAIRLNAEAGGEGGSLKLRASHVNVGNDGLVTAEAGPEATTRGGSIDIRAGRLAVTGGRISAGTLGPALGGDVRIRAGSAELGPDAEIAATSRDRGDAGAIDIDAGERLISRGASITAEAERANGGNITVNARERVHLVHSAITTSVQGGKGPGGNIRIDPDFVILQNSRILANADQGPGGNIDIVAGQFIPDSTSRVDASSRTGIDGRVVISAPDTNMIGKVAALAAKYLDPASLFKERCAARYSAGENTLTIHSLDAKTSAPGEHFYSMAGEPESRPSFSECR